MNGWMDGQMSVFAHTCTLTHTQSEKKFILKPRGKQMSVFELRRWAAVWWATVLPERERERHGGHHSG